MKRSLPQAERRRLERRVVRAAMRFHFAWAAGNSYWKMKMFMLAYRLDLACAALAASKRRK